MTSKTIISLLLIILLGACGRAAQEATTPEKEKLQTTVWTEKTELFMEYDQPSPGQKAGFLLHLTRLSDFKPVGEGPLILTFTPEKGEPVKVQVNHPERPGIFKTAVQFNGTGAYILSALVTGKTFSDEITVKDIVVAAVGGNPGPGSGGEKGGGDIAFLKEQQWTIDFKTGLPLERPIASFSTASGEIVPVARAEATVSTPVAGVLSLSRQLPYPGKRVSKGEVLAVIDPPVSQQGGVGQLAASYAEAKNRVQSAQMEYERARRLVEGQAAPKRRVEEAELALASAKAALAPLDRAMHDLTPGSSGGNLTVRAPFSGTVVELLTANGKAIEAGHPLLRIVDTSSVWLRANVPATEIGLVKSHEQATFTVPGIDGALRPSRFVATGALVDPKTRTVPVLFEVPNPEGRLKVGMFAEVAFTTGQVEHALTLPEEALFEDEGKFFVFVQKEGETFLRREVKKGLRGGGQVQIVSGLRKDERVVLRGGYYVKLASLSSRTAQGHGHEH
ncbi:MAG: efflux RND transporter periplasmic adaptor subunit [Deltaproteobacteria bacterium]|nr:efflux RND transporter periplasmic adaptor subunit [Deltaproteobacteria bacterium]